MVRFKGGIAFTNDGVQDNVSIPKWYDLKKTCRKCSAILREVSIPKWYDLKFAAFVGCVSSYFSFNSKMVRFKAERLCVRRGRLICFNSKMVRFKAIGFYHHQPFLAVSIPKWYDLKRIWV